MTKGLEFSFLHVIQTGPGAHPVSYPMCTGGTFLGVKWPGHEAYHPPIIIAKVKKIHMYTHLHGIMLNQLSTGATLLIFLPSFGRDFVY
jgi:hypothetical protein